MRGKKALRNVIVSIILQLVTILFSFIIPKLIISHYGSSVNGLISSITQFLAYITLLESGIGPVIKSLLYKPISKNNTKEISNILYASSTFFKNIAKIFLIYILIICFGFSFAFIEKYDFFFTASLILIVSVSTFGEYYFGITYRLFLQANQESYIVSLIQIVTAIINTLSIIVLIKIGSSIQIVKLFSAFIFVLRPLIINFYAKRKYKISFKNVNKDYRIDQRWNGLALHIASIIHSNTDIVILTIFSTLEEVSVYSVYLLVVKGVKSIVDSLASGIDATFGDMLAKREHKVLNRSFKIYELFYFTISSILFICSIILIVPFVKVYTNGINDVDYIRPLFGLLIVLSEFVYAVRVPYHMLVKTAGHFKQTMIGSWVEAGINIFVSILLVWKFGLVGVAIGTLLAMIIRTVELIVYTSKNILKRNVIVSFTRLFAIVIATFIILFLNKVLFCWLTVSSFKDWIIYGFNIALITSFVVVCVNFILFKEDFVSIYSVLKNRIDSKKAN